MPGTESLGRIGYGTKIYYGDGMSPEVFTQIPEVVNITGIGRTRPRVDITHLDSPDESMEYTRGLKDGKQPTVTLWKTSDTIQLIDTLMDRTEINIRVDYPAFETDTAFRQAFTVVPIDDDGGTIAPNDPMQIVFQFAIDGPIVVTEIP
jgi:hypothetical protein